LCLASLLCYVLSRSARRAPSSTLFPYTTLFRSEGGDDQHQVPGLEHAPPLLHLHAVDERRGGEPRHEAHVLDRVPGPVAAPAQRSEEHTSELQSRENLVCRLLLEKKK